MVPADIQRIKPPFDKSASDNKERGEIFRRIPEKKKAELTKRQVQPAEFLSDIPSGLDDAGLMLQVQAFGARTHQGYVQTNMAGTHVLHRVVAT